jgi:hypothetical protein
MSFLGAAKVAYYEAMGAAIVIPTAWPAVAIIYLAESDPQALWTAAQGCFDTAGEIDKAHREVQQLVDGLSAESWTGDDRDAFQARMTDYMDQLNFSYGLAVTMGVVLTVIAGLIAVFILLMFLIASFLALLAAAIIALYASIVGAAAAAELQAEANIFGAECSETLTTASNLLTTASDALTAILGAALAVDVAGQPFFGNTRTVPDLLQATVHASGLMIKGTLQYGERKLLAGGLGGKSVDLFFRDSILGRSLARGIGFQLPVPETARLGGRIFGSIAGVSSTQKGDTIFSSNVPTSFTDPASSDGYGDSYVNKTQPHR